MIDGQQYSRRALLRGSAAVFGATVLAACGGRLGAPGPSQPGAPAALKGNVIWLGRTLQLENDWQRNTAVPRMKQLYPNIEVVLELTADATWAERVFAMDAAGTPPEVFSGYRGTFITLYAQSKVLELTPLIKRDRFDLKPFGGFERDADMCRSGKQWGLPVLTTHGIMTFYNIGLLEQAGVKLPPTSWEDKSWTWERLADIARKTTKNWGQPDAVYGYFPFGQFHPWAYLWKGDPWPPEFYRHGIAQTTNFTSPAVVEATQFWQDLVMKFQVSPQGGTPTKRFAEGGAAMWGVNGWVVADLRSVDLFKWALAPVPWQKDNKTIGFTDNLIAHKSTRAPEATWALMRYLTGQEGQTDYSRATGRPPTRLDALEPWLDRVLPTTGFQRKDQLREVMLGYLKNYVDNWPHYVLEAHRLQTIQNDAQNRLLEGNVPASALLVDVKTRMEAELRDIYQRYKDNAILLRDTLC